MIALSEHELPRVTAVKLGEEWIRIVVGSLELDEQHANFEQIESKLIYKAAIEFVQAVRMRGD